MEKAIQNDTVEPPDDPPPAAASAPAENNPTASTTAKPAAPAKRTRSTAPGRQGAEHTAAPAVVQR